MGNTAAVGQCSHRGCLSVDTALKSIAPVVEKELRVRCDLPVECRPVRRIAHVLASVNPDSGGPATVVCRLAAAQAALGHQVSIISSLSSHVREEFAASTEKIPGFPRVQLLVAPLDNPLRGDGSVRDCCRSIRPFSTMSMSCTSTASGSPCCSLPPPAHARPASPTSCALRDARPLESRLSRLEEKTGALLLASPHAQPRCIRPHLERG